MGPNMHRAAPRFPIATLVRLSHAVEILVGEAVSLHVLLDVCAHLPLQSELAQGVPAGRSHPVKYEAILSSS